MTYIEKLFIAGAVGDAMGYLVEFDNLHAIHTAYGGDFTFQEFNTHNIWTVSDDTQMTMFYLYAVLNNTSIVDGFKEWFYSQSGSVSHDGLRQFSSLCCPRAPGMTCLSALGSSTLGTLSNRINDSKGCGSIMRTMPSILNTSSYSVFEAAATQSAITHGHDLGILSSAWFAIVLAYPHLSIHDRITLAHTISYDFSMRYSMQNAHALMTAKTESVLAEIHHGKKLRHHALTQKFGEGWTADDAYQIALYTALVADDFYDCLHLSINHNGDSDSTGSLAAQLYVSLHPTVHIPQEWVSKLDVSDSICFLTKSFDHNMVYSSPSIVSAHVSSPV